MSPYTVFAALARRWKWVVGVPVLFCVVAVGLYLLGEPRFAAHSRFAPQSSEGGMVSFGALAAQLGVPIGGGASSTESVQFYAQLVESRELLERAALAQYAEAGGATLLERLDIRGSTADERLQLGVAWLKANTIVTVDTRANLVNVTTLAPTRELAVELNRQVLELVNDFNIARRRSQAAAEREFVQTRVEGAEQELREAERALETFLERNRRYEGSPELSFQYGRLQRTVDLRQAVFTSLAQRFEQARVDEVRATPVITVVEGPERSATPARRPVRSVALALVLGTFFGLAAALVVEYLAYERQRNPEAYAELSRFIPGRRRSRGAAPAPAAARARVAAAVDGERG